MIRRHIDKTPHKRFFKKKGFKNKKKKPFSRTFKLLKNPQTRGLVRRMIIRSPKKPNSGKRRVVKCVVKKYRYRDRITCRVTGRHIMPRKFNHALIEGGRANDTPGVSYTAIRGAHGFPQDAPRFYRRSIYGVYRHGDDFIPLKTKRRLRTEGRHFPRVKYC